MWTFYQLDSDFRIKIAMVDFLLLVSTRWWHNSHKGRSRSNSDMQDTKSWLIKITLTIYWMQWLKKKKKNKKTVIRCTCVLDVVIYEKQEANEHPVKSLFSLPVGGGRLQFLLSKFKSWLYHCYGSYPHHSLSLFFNCHICG